MSNIEDRIAAVPITNHQAWNQILKLVNDFPLPIRHDGVINLRVYNPGTDEWEHHDVARSLTPKLAELIKWVPLGGDNFAEWLKTGKVSGRHYNHPSDPRYIAHYLEIDWLCRVLEVGNSLVYCESEDSWYWTIESSAQVERFIGKNYSLSSACECVLVHLFTIGKKLLCEKRGISDEGQDSDVKTDLKRERQFIGVQKGRKSFHPDVWPGVKIHTVNDVQFTLPNRESAGDFDYHAMERSEERIVYRVTIDGNKNVVGYITFDLIEKNIEWDVKQPMVGCYIEFSVHVVK